MPPAPLPAQLGELAELLGRMGVAATGALRRATAALLDGRERLAQQVVAGDAVVDALRARVEEIAADALLFHAPVAGDLRAVVSSIRAAGDIERMGDLALHVAQAAQRGRALPAEVRADLAEMGRVAVALGLKAAEVARTRNVLLAVELDADDDEMDALHLRMFGVLLDPAWQHGVPAAVDATLLARYYERFADHAVRVARETVYAVTGQAPESIACVEQPRERPFRALGLPERAVCAQPAWPSSIKEGPMRELSEPGLSRGGQRRVLVVLCVTQVVSWGVLYYAFPVLAISITRDTGWSTSAITAAFSVSLVVSGLVGIPVGRWLDRWGPRAVMTTGSVLAVPAVVWIASAQSYLSFLAAWVLAGVAMAGVLYPPAFAALTRWWSPRHVRGLTALTLVAGLSSTVFAPLTAALLDGSDWRRTYLVLAVVLAVITIPAHLIGLRGPWPEAPDSPDAGGDEPRRIARSRPFVVFTIAMTLATFSVYAVLINLVPLLLERGLTTSDAALALGLGGAGQVAGRLFYGRLAAVTGVRVRTALVIGACAATTGVLAVIPGPAALLTAVAILVGAGRGLFTLVQATAITDRWGPAHYGRLSAVMSAPGLIATAVAPWAGAALAQALGSNPAVFGILAAVAAVAAVLVAADGSSGAKPQRKGRG